MHVHAPIHLVVEYRVQAHGRTAHCVTCEACKQEYVYISSKTATARVWSPFDAFTDRYIQRLGRARAERRLKALLSRPELVACPACGWYQQPMVQEYRRPRLRLAVAACCAIAGMCLAAWPLTGNQPDAARIMLGLAAVGTLAGIALVIRSVLDNPNQCPTGLERKARATTSRGVPAEDYHRKLINSQAEQASREEAFFESLTGEPSEAERRVDWLGLAAEKADPAAYDAMRWEESTLRRRRSIRERQSRRWQVLQLAAIPVGASVGVFLDWAAFGANPNGAIDRAAAALVAGVLCGGLVHAFGLRIAYSLFAASGSHARRRERTWVKADLPRIVNMLAVVAAAISAAYCAAGAQAASPRQYALVIGGQLTTSALVLVIRLLFGDAEDGRINAPRGSRDGCHRER